MAVKHLEVVKIDVFTEHLFKGTGSVARWNQKITRRFTREAKKYVLAQSTRTGELYEGISSTTKGSALKHTCTGTIISKAPHTMYVLRGTTGPIMSNKAFVNRGGAWKVVTKFSSAGVPYERWERQSGYWMPIPPLGGGREDFNPKAGQGFWAIEVEGQTAHNFFERAWRATARDHRAIRGKIIPTFIKNP